MAPTMIDPRSVDRIRRQETNSGGFAEAVVWERLDHRRHHPALEVRFGDGAVVEGRKSRQRYIAAAYGAWLGGRVVDVGCDRALLRPLVPGHYVGIDLFGDPDVRFDLQSGRPLPLADRSADFVACTDVLEHLFDPHFYCDELFRIARDKVLIGLPNCWTALWRSFCDGMPANKNYGLPPERPGDAHRWTFCTEESVDFVLYRAAKHGFQCTVMTHFTAPPTFGLRWLERGLWGRIPGKLLDLSTRALEAVIDRRGSRTWLNRHVAATWWLLERNAEAPS